MPLPRLVVILSLLLSHMLWAAYHPIPRDFLYLGKPIDPLCFSNLDSHTKLIDLNHCGKASCSSQGSSDYQVFKAGKRRYWIYTMNHGLGSGDFTAIAVVKVKKIGLLEVNHVMSGDRCNGGIQDVQERDHHLFFSVNMTAYDFLTLAKDNPHHLKPYDDLAACATCCVAKVFYEIDSAFKLKLREVDLGSHEVRLEEMPTQGRYQACFNKLIVSYMMKGQSKFNDKKLRQLVNAFNHGCRIEMEGSKYEADLSQYTQDRCSRT